ncbi:MAG TPA: UMP kinase [Candidatus Pacearchaeota archaeon]|nr:UMP kinase [Candidatus Pacearchaeota archaeon]
MNKKRILLKLTGELFGNKDRAISLLESKEIAKKIIKLKKIGIDLAIVIGGGNIFRGREVGAEKFDRAVADNMGMLATIINGLSLQESLEGLGAKTRMLTAIEMPKVAEPFYRRRALHHLEKNRIIIFSGGTGNPFFTTDTAAVLRACEINADYILKATDVDGVYDKDPDTNKDAKMYKTISFKEVIEKDLKVMDSTAFTLCRDNNIPLIVFNVKYLDKIEDILKNKIGTLVK